MDFSDTTSRLGPVDAIKGRKKSKPSTHEAPFAICDSCGAQVRPANSLECPECGALLREAEEKAAREASNAAIMKSQLLNKINTYEVTSVTYSLHVGRESKLHCIKVDYWNGIRIVCSEYIFLNRVGFSKEIAVKWWIKWVGVYIPSDLYDCVEMAKESARRPSKITVDEAPKYPVLLKLEA